MHPTASYYLDDGAGWRPYRAWHPVWTEDKGWVWAMPWRRVDMFRRFGPAIGGGFISSQDVVWIDPVAHYAINPSCDLVDGVYVSNSKHLSEINYDGGY